MFYPALRIATSLSLLLATATLPVLSQNTLNLVIPKLDERYQDDATLYGSIIEIDDSTTWFQLYCAGHFDPKTTTIPTPAAGAAAAPTGNIEDTGRSFFTTDGPCGVFDGATVVVDSFANTSSLRLLGWFTDSSTRPLSSPVEPPATGNKPLTPLTTTAIPDTGGCSGGGTQEILVTQLSVVVLVNCTATPSAAFLGVTGLTCTGATTENANVEILAADGTHKGWASGITSTVSVSTVFLIGSPAFPEAVTPSATGTPTMITAIVTGGLDWLTA